MNGRGFGGGDVVGSGESLLVLPFEEVSGPLRSKVYIKQCLSRGFISSCLLHFVLHIPGALVLGGIASFMSEPDAEEPAQAPPLTCTTVPLHRQT